MRVQLRLWVSLHHAGLAIDKSGKLLLAYRAGNEEKEPQKMWITT